MSAMIDRIRDLVTPLLAELDVELYDLDYSGGSLRVVLDRPAGLDVNLITAATRKVSAALDEADIIPSAYTLEVSSPGLERALRTPAHFARAVGEQVKIKTFPGVEGDRRIEGELTAADDGTVTVTSAGGDERILDLADIERAHTAFDWGPAPKPGGPKKKPANKNSPAKKKTPTQKKKSSESTTPSTSPTQSEATS